jgi:hypothetical protein
MASTPSALRYFLAADSQALAAAVPAGSARAGRGCEMAASVFVIPSELSPLDLLPDEWWW